MTEEQLSSALCSFGYPVAYGLFAEEQIPPYIIYMREDDDSIKADGTTYYQFKNYKIELYVSEKSIAIENAIETMFKQHDIEYDVYEQCIKEDKDEDLMFLIIYTITI